MYTHICTVPKQAHLYMYLTQLASVYTYGTYGNSRMKPACANSRCCRQRDTYPSVFDVIYIYVYVGYRCIPVHGIRDVIYVHIGDVQMFAEAGLRELTLPPPESILNAQFEPLWLTCGTPFTHPHTHTNTQTRTHTHIPTSTHTHTYAHTHTRTHIYKHAHTQTHTYLRL